MSRRPVDASFRDPAGFVYERDGVVLRQVNPAGAPKYDALLASGLYDVLTERGWLVAHEELPVETGAYRTLRPAPIRYVSYPYEWCFDQLRDAALLTLDIQLLALARGLTLSDASAFNVQFIGHRPVFIDTLSFETYRDGTPWVAYRQYCQHFLAPLALMSHVDRRTRHLLVHHLDGIPLDLASRLLPRRTRWRYGLLAHVHLHAASQRRHQRAGGTTPTRIPRLSKARQVALLRSLRATVQGCRPPRGETTWSDYYADTNYSETAMRAKVATVERMIATMAAPGTVVHDLGANTGRFAALASGAGRYVVAHDVDELAVARHYRGLASADQPADILPLVLDLTNPSPALGWSHTERQSAFDRIAGGTVLALALVHHLAIANNVPLPRLAATFARIAPRLIVEFVPKDDSQVRRLLATREDVFPDYTPENFTAAFSAHYRIDERVAIDDSSRTLFAMRAPGDA